MEPVIFQQLRRVQTEQDDGRREELRAETAQQLGRHFARFTPDMEELAFDLLNIAWADAMDGDVVNQLIDVKTVGLGEPDYVDEDLRGMRAYIQGKGGQILSDIMRYTRTLMPREEMVAAIDIHRDEIELDFWGTFDRLTGQAKEKLQQLPTHRLVELLQAAITTGTFFGSFAYSTISSDQFDPILESVLIRANGQVNIVGTEVAIRRLSNIGLDYGPNVQQQIFATGQIASYKGVPVVQVKNFQNFEGYFVLPHDEIWLVGRNAGRLTYYGPTAKVQQLQKESFYVRWETARDFGMLLYGVGRGRLGRLVLT